LNFVRNNVAIHWTTSLKNLDIIEKSIQIAIDGSGDFQCALIKVVYERVVESKGNKSIHLKKILCLHEKNLWLDLRF
jgi:hypothetical protein